MSIEKTVLLVKPDGVSKNLVEAIRKIVLAFDLEIQQEVRRTLTYEEAHQMYALIGNVKQRDYFDSLVNFMCSADSHLLYIVGESAIIKVRTIIGKREPASGIRSWWATDIIRNVAHAPHDYNEAKSHISILFGESS